MKTKELKLMNEPDLENKVIELKKELMKINSQIAIGMVPKNPSRQSGAYYLSRVSDTKNTSSH